MWKQKKRRSSLDISSVPLSLLRDVWDIESTHLSASPNESQLLSHGAGVEQHAVVLPQCRAVHHSPCMDLLPSPLSLGQTCSRLLWNAVLIAVTLHAIPHYFEM